MSTGTAILTKPADYYATLGVARTAKFVQIRKRYLSLVQEVHPDRYADPAEKARRSAQFKAIVEAWDVLSNPDLRARYDLSLDGGAAFDAQKAAAGGTKNWDTIAAETERFGFSEKAGNLPKEHRTMIDEMLINDAEFKERVLTSLKVLGHSLGSMPLNCVRGVTQGACYAVISNFGLVGAIHGESQTQQGNTRYTVKYTNGFRLDWMSTDRMDLELDPIAQVFNVTFYGSENRLSGMTFKCSGSPYPLLWIADLYDIETVFRLQYARVRLKKLTVTLLMAALIGAVGLLYWDRIAPLADFNADTALQTLKDAPVSGGAVALAVVLTPIHLLSEFVRAWRAQRIQRVCDKYQKAALTGKA
jgi:DnaJ-domain-containing protein 1